MAFINGVALWVHDYDQAIAWYTEVLGFELESDVPAGDGKRFVRLCAPKGEGAALILTQAATAAQQALVGKQAGQGVLLFLQCDDFDERVAKMQSQGVTLCETPRDEPYAKVVIFEDLLGNRWDLLQPKNAG